MKNKIPKSYHPLYILSRITLTRWILIAWVLGGILGILVPSFALQLKPLRGLFLNGIKCIVAPLIMGSIISGICSAGSAKNLGRIGLKAIIWFEIATTLALVVGLLFANVFRPGKGIALPVGEITDGIEKATQTHLSFGGFLEHLLPTNIADAVVRGDVLQIVIFSTLIGIATLSMGEKGRPIKELADSLSQVMFKFTAMIMWLAPFGVGAAMAISLAEHGVSVLLPLLKLVSTLYGALIVFTLMTLIPALMWARIKIIAFFKELRPALILAFATTSSESAYPQTLQSLEKMGVSNRIASFVLPLGYSFNLDGSTLYLAIASLFVSQAAGIDLSLWTQLSLMLTLMLSTKGVAAVPRASLVVLAGTLTTFNIPLEGIGLILGVDAVMDMARTTVNLLGNSVATTVVSKWENEKLSSEFQYHRS